MTNSRWLLTWLLAAAITVAGWLAFETYWRGRGYQPTVMDSMDLWSLNRARAVKAAPPLRVALLGASRIQYGLSPSVFRDEARGTDPIMLAVNGHYPFAALRDLAMDEKFKGVAIVGIDSRGMDKRVWEMQEKYVQQYHHDWSPSREVHRRLLTYVQQHAIAARPELAVAVSKPSRLSVLSTNRSSPGSSSTMRMWAGVEPGILDSARWFAIDLGHLHQANE